MEKPKQATKTPVQRRLIVVVLAAAVFGLSIGLNYLLLGYQEWKLTIWATWITTALVVCIVHSHQRKIQGKSLKFADDVVFNIIMIVLALGALVFWFVAPSSNPML